MSRRGAASFAEGLMAGYTTQTKLMMEKERHELDMAKRREEKAMNDEFKAVEASARPTQSFAVTGADGIEQVYTDQKQAMQAVAGGGQLRSTFTVAGRQFGTEDEAKQAAEAASAPAARLRQRAEIALKYNRPELADAYHKNYQTALAGNRREMQERFLEMRNGGDLQAALDGIGRRSGEQYVLADGESGVEVVRMKGGQVLGRQPFGSTSEVWDGLQQQIMATPDNMVEVWKAREGLKIDNARLAETSRSNLAQESQGNRRLDQGQSSLDLQGRKLEHDVYTDRARIGLQAQGMGLEAGRLQLGRDQLGLERSKLDRPTAVSGVSPGGDTVMSYYRPVQGADGSWSMDVGQPQTISGLRPVASLRNQDPFAGLFGGSGSAPISVDFSKIPPKNIQGPAPAGPAPQMQGTIGGGPARGGPVYEPRTQNLIDQIPLGSGLRLR